MIVVFVIITSIGRMKRYAELHGDMQKYRIKSRYDNMLEAMKTIGSMAIKPQGLNIQKEAIKSMKTTATQMAAVANVIGKTAMTKNFSGGEPSPCYGTIHSMHRVNSRKISPRQP